MGSRVVASESLAAKFGSILPHLDERQRRLLLGAEARALGHGGGRLGGARAGARGAPARAGAAGGRVCRGAGEGEAGREPRGGARGRGGGRKPLPETDPGLIPV